MAFLARLTRFLQQPSASPSSVPAGHAVSAERNGGFFVCRPQPHHRLLVLVLTFAPLFAGFTQDQAGRSVDLRGADEETLTELRREVADEIQRIEGGDGRAADVADIAYTMEQHLRGNGFAEAVVEYRMFGVSPDGTREAVRTAAKWLDVRYVEFQVSPGKKTFFGTFSFEGNSYFSDQRLRDQIPIAETLSAASAIPFELSRVRSAVRRIENMYTLVGFADVRVGPSEQQNREEPDAVFVDITIPISEGVRYTITDVQVVAPGIPSAIQANLMNGIGIKGSAFYSRKIVEGETEIFSILGNEGYRPEISATTSRDSTTGSVEVRYDVEAGPQYILGEVHVRGRSDSPLRTRERFIRRMVPLSPGDVLRSDALEVMENRLYDLGVFSLIGISEEPQDGGEPEEAVPADLIVSIREARSRYAEVAAGWGSYELLRGRVNYTDNNVFGRALSWSTTGAISFRTREISSSLTDRTLFGPAVRVTVDGAYGYRDGPSYDRTRTEGGLTTFYALSDMWEVDASYRYSYTLADAISAEIAGEEDTALATGRIGTGGSFDSRDSVLIPTRGQRLGAHAFWASEFFGSDIDFWGVDMEGATHHRITDGTYLSMVGSYRTRMRLDNRRTLPIQERLFLGGSRSVRSFVQDRLGPGSADGDPLGGLSSAHATVELRQRITGDLFIAAFYDIGTVQERAWEIAGAYGSGVGLGLRYHLPIGPLRLDASYNPGETFTQDRRWAVHFAVGFSF
ncbi:MAG: BamA/TamA family outer membrane protein [Spirochaeta sp.]|jgi:outer membrane protein insertion porin family|nr:BamA/TamA family outer membrane protein [Spirochaeta sp.]